MVKGQKGDFGIRCACLFFSGLMWGKIRIEMVFSSPVKSYNFGGSMASTKPNIGDVVRLRNGILPDVKIRDWTFLGKTPDTVILVSYKAKGRILKVVKEDDIDWDDHRKKNLIPSFGRDPLRA